MSHQSTSTLAICRTNRPVPLLFVAPIDQYPCYLSHQSTSPLASCRTNRPVPLLFVAPIDQYPCYLSHQSTSTLAICRTNRPVPLLFVAPIDQYPCYLSHQSTSTLASCRTNRPVPLLVVAPIDQYPCYLSHQSTSTIAICRTNRPVPLLFFIWKRSPPQDHTGYPRLTATCVDGTWQRPVRKINNGAWPRCAPNDGTRLSNRINVPFQENITNQCARVDSPTQIKLSQNTILHTSIKINKVQNKELKKPPKNTVHIITNNSF